MDGDAESLQAHYVPLEASRPDASQPAFVIVLPVPRPYGRYSVSAMEIEKSLPSAVGAYVDWLVTRSGWTVTERRNPDARVPLEPRHICLLFRRFVSYGEDITRKYVEALEARGIRHLLVGGKTFHDREEIETSGRHSPQSNGLTISYPSSRRCAARSSQSGTRNCSTITIWPSAFIRSAFREALPSHLEPIRDALKQLAVLHAARNGRPAADTVVALLDHTRAHVAFVSVPAANRPSRTCFTLRSSRGNTSLKEACRSADSWKRCTRALQPRRLPRRRSSKREATAYV